jgi:hypothetical protein
MRDARSAGERACVRRYGRSLSFCVSFAEGKVDANDSPIKKGGKGDTEHG